MEGAIAMLNAESNSSIASEIDKERRTYDTPYTGWHFAADFEEKIRMLL